MKQLPQAQVSSHHSLKGGFSFVETLVAITVLLVAVVAPMSLAQEGIMAARLSQDQIVAFYLAQEGIEAVKNIRDNNRLDGSKPEQLQGLDDCNIGVASNTTGLGCTIDAKGGVGGQFITAPCPSTGCPVMRKSESAPFWYGYDATGMEDTKFTREVRVWYPDTNNRFEATAEVIVTWPFGKAGITKSYTVQNRLYNW